LERIVRWQEPPSPAVPEQLARYLPSEWPNADDPLLAWVDARLAFVDEHPNTPLGGLVETLGEWRRLKIEAAWTAPVQPAQFRHPDIG
jgi:hypothetical protein